MFWCAVSVCRCTVCGWSVCTDVRDALSQTSCGAFSVCSGRAVSLRWRRQRRKSLSLSVCALGSPSVFQQLGSGTGTGVSSRSWSRSEVGHYKRSRSVQICIWHTLFLLELVHVLIPASTPSPSLNPLSLPHWLPSSTFSLPPSPLLPSPVCFCSLNSLSAPASTRSLSTYAPRLLAVSSGLKTRCVAGIVKQMRGKQHNMMTRKEGKSFPLTSRLCPFVQLHSVMYVVSLALVAARSRSHWSRFSEE